MLPPHFDFALGNGFLTRSWLRGEVSTGSFDDSKETLVFVGFRRSFLVSEGCFCSRICHHVRRRKELMQNFSFRLNLRSIFSQVDVTSSTELSEDKQSSTVAGKDITQGLLFSGMCGSFGTDTKE